MSASRVVLLAVAGVAVAVWAGIRIWPRKIEFRPVALIPVWTRADGRDVLALPGRYLVAEIARYDDEFFTYLMFSYLRGVRELKQSEVLMTYSRTPDGLVYAIRVRLPDDLLSSLPLLSDAVARGLIEDYSWRYLTGDALGRLRYESRLFLTAYRLPARRSLEKMSRAQLVRYIRHFIRFKSLTDPRIRRRIEPVPSALSTGEARQLAEDIVAVADFYSLPLDFFLGIGAMENNFMDVPGDLQHAIWKRRAEKGDAVLKRQRGKVLVVNSSLGVWQITRQTLRYAHSLYLKDRRDDSLLPARLRPPRELDINNVAPEVLTTYAGLLFRDLIDRCKGDVTLAVAAYNGGLGNPNLRYAEGVRTVAEYARRIMEHAAVLNGPAAGRRFLTAQP